MPLRTDLTNLTPALDEHPAHHNALAAAVNDVVDARLPSLESGQADQGADIAVLREAPANVEHYAAPGEQFDGVDVNDASFLAAYNALPSTGSRRGGQILIPRRIKTTVPLAINKSDVSIVGPGGGKKASLISNSVSDIFTLADTATVTNFHMENMFLSSGGQGHVFAVRGDVSQWSIKNSQLSQNGTAKRIWDQPSGRLIGGKVEDCYMSVPAAATVAPWFVSSNAGLANANVFQGGWFYGPDNHPFFYIEETSVGSYLYKWTFRDNIFEICRGGLIHAYGAWGWKLEDVQNWDMASRGVSTAPGVLFSKSATGLRSVFCTVEDYMRSNGTLGGGQYDIKLDNPGAERCVIRHGNNATLTTFAVDLGGGVGHRVEGLPARGVTIDGKSSTMSGWLHGYENTPYRAPALLFGTCKLVFGTAAPLVGEWVVGDRVVNSVPAVGSPKGWACTVAGTPGTWVSEGNL